MTYAKVLQHREKYKKIRKNLLTIHRIYENILRNILGGDDR